MFSSSNFGGAVLDFGFLAEPLATRLLPSMVVHVHGSRRAPGLKGTIQRTLGPVLKSIWKCFG